MTELWIAVSVLSALVGYLLVKKESKPEITTNITDTEFQLIWKGKIVYRIDKFKI